MDAFEIRGGRPLHGETRIYGAKNAALPILAATVMVEDICELDDVPQLEDVAVMMEILRTLGAKVDRRGSSIVVDSRHIRHTNVPPDLMRKMRSPILSKVLRPALSVA